MSQHLTNDNVFNPTPAEKKLLELMILPENHLITVKELCEKAGVSKTVYYDCQKKPYFVALQKEITMSMIKGSVDKVLAATIKFATEGSNNHADRKILLTMAGIYDDKQKVEMSGTMQNNNVNLNLDGMTKEDLLELLKATRG